MKGFEFSEKKVYMGRLPYGGDLLNCLNGFIRDKDIRKGQVQVIGALQKAVIGFYSQDNGEYRRVEFDNHTELLSLMGNISVKDGEPFIHAHITVGDQDGSSYGGHLMEGTIVFAAEFIIREFDGSDLVRVYDEKTGLTLWNI